MRPSFTLIEILTAIVIMGIVMVVSIQSINYINHIHQQNEIRYLALNRLDSEMSRLVMAYENDYNTSSNFMTTGSIKTYLSTSNNGIRDGDYGLKISTGIDKINFVQLKDIGGNFNKVEDGDIVGILNWQEINSVANKEVTLSVNLTYPYIYHSNLPKLWSYTETINIKTSTKVK